jgi:hypothetical protein
MEPPKATVRAILPLLKARVVARGQNHFKLAFGAEYGSPTTITITVPMEMYDIRDGDLLTLYTEVMLKPAEGNG